MPIGTKFTRTHFLSERDERPIPFIIGRVKSRIGTVKGVETELIDLFTEDGWWMTFEAEKSLESRNFSLSNNLVE